MKVTNVDHGIQIECNSILFSVLVTVCHHPDYGFSGGVIIKPLSGKMRMVRFHGDGIDGVISHAEEDFRPDAP